MSRLDDPPGERRQREVLDEVVPGDERVADKGGQAEEGRRDAGAAGGEYPITAAPSPRWAFSRRTLARCPVGGSLARRPLGETVARRLVGAHRRRHRRTVVAVQAGGTRARVVASRAEVAGTIEPGT